MKLQSHFKICMSNTVEGRVIIKVGATTDQRLKDNQIQNKDICVILFLTSPVLLGSGNIKVSTNYDKELNKSD
jgi:hypothetical protein